MISGNDMAKYVKIILYVQFIPTPDIVQYYYKYNAHNI